MIRVECPPGVPWPAGQTRRAIVGVPIAILVVPAGATVALTGAPPGSEAELYGFAGSMVGAIAPDVAGLYRVSIVFRGEVRVLDVIAVAGDGSDESGADRFAIRSAEPCEVCRA